MTMNGALRVLILGIFPLVLVGTAFASFWSHALLIRRLREAHSKLWDSLGRPGILIVAPQFQMRFAIWLWTWGFDGAGDSELSLLGKKCVGATFILCVTLLLWVTLAFIKGYILPR